MFFDQQQSYLFSHQSIIFDDDSTGNKRTLIKLTFQLSTLNSSTSVDRPLAGHTMVPWCPNEALSSVSRIRQYPHLSEQIFQTTLVRLFAFLRSGLMKVPQTLTFLLNGVSSASLCHASSHAAEESPAGIRVPGAGENVRGDTGCHIMPRPYFLSLSLILRTSNYLSQGRLLLSTSERMTRTERGDNSDMTAYVSSGTVYFSQHVINIIFCFYPKPLPRVE